MKAAILYQTRTPLRVEEVELEKPGPGEVMVKLVAAGVCHTDLAVVHGDVSVPLPVVLGHEGAGIVQQVGAGVTSVKPGDHVVLTGGASCGKCYYCIKGMPVLCEIFRPLRFGGFLPEKQLRLKKNGQKLHHFFLQSSFAEYSVVPQEVAIKVRQDAPLETIGILGCGVMTGLGSVLNAAQVGVGASVAVFGCGGVGLSAIMAANLAGAYRIIAVDILENKLKMAEDLGANYTLDARKGKVVERITQMTGGGADYTIIAVGSVDATLQAIDAVRLGGKCIIIAAPPEGIKIPLDPRSLLRERILRGCSMGSGKPTLDIPRYVDLYMDGKLPIDKLVTHRYPLIEINQACEALDQGEAIKPVIML
jgi:Zn-dependent alcohol dehydrogenase